MTRRTLEGHEDFMAAPERRRYAGSLRGLFTYLSFESERHPGTECWRVLRGGAVVSLKRKPNGKRILRISRSDRPVNDDARAKWSVECATFLQHFGCVMWTRVDDDTAAGVATFFHEEQPGIRCVECGELVDPALLPLADRCADCAAAAVREKAGVR